MIETWTICDFCGHKTKEGRYCGRIEYQVPSGNICTPPITKTKDLCPECTDKVRAVLNKIEKRKGKR